MKKQRSNALWQLLVLVALAAAVALTLAWPQLPFARREGEPVEVSVILRGTDGSDWANARLGMEQAAGELRAEVRIVTLSAENDAAEQARLMGYEAQRGADVLVVIPAGELPAEPGAPVITLESAGGAASVCPDNEALGRALAAAALVDAPAGPVLLVNSAVGHRGGGRRQGQAGPCPRPLRRGLHRVHRRGAGAGQPCRQRGVERFCRGVSGGGRGGAHRPGRRLAAPAAGFFHPAGGGHL